MREFLLLRADDWDTERAAHIAVERVDAAAEAEVNGRGGGLEEADDDDDEEEEDIDGVGPDASTDAASIAARAAAEAALMAPPPPPPAGFEALAQMYSAIASDTIQLPTIELPSAISTNLATAPTPLGHVAMAARPNQPSALVRSRPRRVRARPQGAWWQTLSSRRHARGGRWSNRKAFMLLALGATQTSALHLTAPASSHHASMLRSPHSLASYHCHTPLSGFARAISSTAPTTPTHHARARVVMAAEPPREDGTDIPEEVGRSFGLLMFAQLVLFIGVGAVIPVIPLYGKSIGLSGVSNGLVISAPAVALLLAAQPSGKFADVARLPAMMMGMALIIASDIGTALSSSLAPLLVARLGLGAGRAISESGERGMLADFAARVPSLRGRGLATQQAVLALGIAIGAPLGGIAVDMYGARAAFLCVSAAATCTLVLYSLLPETVPTRDTEEDSPTKTMLKPLKTLKTLKTQPDADTTPAAQPSRWALLLEDVRWRGLCFAESGARFGFAAKVVSVPILAASAFTAYTYSAGEGAGPSGAAAAGLLLSAAGAAGLIGATAGGWLTDQRGARATAIASGVTSGVALLLVPVALSSTDAQFAAPAFAALIVLWSIGATAQGPSLTALAQTLAPAGAEAESLSLPRAAGDGTFIFAPALIGGVADAMPAMPGIECAVAGGAVLLGVAGLALTTGDEE